MLPYLSLDTSKISPARVQITNLHEDFTAQTECSTGLAGCASKIPYCCTVWNFVRGRVGMKRGGGGGGLFRTTHATIVVDH